MKRIVTFALTCTALSLSGCDALLAILDQLNPQPTTISVVFDNTSEFAVGVGFYNSPEQDLPRELLTNPDLADTNETTFTVGANDSVQFALDCENAQAMSVDDADLLVVAGAGPEADSDILRENTDFECGDTITFTFVSDDITDLRITVSVTAPGTDNMNANGDNDNADDGMNNDNADDGMNDD